MELKVVPETILNVAASDLTAFIRHAYNWDATYGNDADTMLLYFDGERRHMVVIKSPFDYNEARALVSIKNKQSFNTPKGLSLLMQDMANRGYINEGTYFIHAG